ncbi:uncharacterized protein DNG_00721 [Cephalotrichum gorgonifer]|uniref:Uncharacterized protein n=1 Tax=Cephalotrichum gorgonifer TaxID=2041049 RepID=A0AAE8MPC9_9PEZI|nr:uncharacterized protein DNG_00721 [Cephalotrichum gorgonifer]
MDLEVEDVELLVHIAAPATAAADERYRELARAYLDFVPSRATKLSELDDPAIASSIDVVEDSFIETEPPKENSIIRTPPADECLPAGGATPHHSTRAVPGCYPDPTPPGHVGGGVEGSSHSPGTVTPSSQGDVRDGESLIHEVPDSYVAGSPGFSQYLSPTRMLEHHLRRMREAGRAQKRPRPPEEAPERVSQGSADKSSARKSQKVARTHSQHAPRPPTSPPALPGGPLRRYRSDQGAQTIAEPTALPAPRSMSEPPTSSAPEILTSYKKKFGDLEIFPPEPPVSGASLDESSFLTPHLEKLGEEMALQRRYRPLFHPPPSAGGGDGSAHGTGRPRPLERGYWLLDMSAWDETDRWTAWALLHGWISGGGAGWGVWCRRDEHCVRIRTYCWASVAGHIYLLLQVVSRGRSKYVDMGWIGDDGRVRISVPQQRGV